MKTCSLFAICLFTAASLPAQNLRIVNAASLTSGSVTPGAIVTIFGTGLAASPAAASDVQHPPLTLGGVTVSIGGTPAALFYVSPTQINLVVGAATPAGTQTVAVTRTGSTQTGSLTIDANAAPGLFSLFGTGTRDGAILNAITFLLGDFSTRTANSPTYLALFATGLNLSNTANVTVTIGGVNVPVVFAGAAPCCAGLDQVNIMLPDSLAGAGRVPVVLSQGGHASNTVQVVLLPSASQRQFSNDEDNTTRAREIASLASVTGTSLVLVTDENDDVVRVADVRARQITKLIALPDGARPSAVAVTGNGATALVVETGRDKVAVVDLTTFAVTAEIAVGAGPVRVAIGATQAVVVNGDADTVSIVDLATRAVQKTLPVGRGPVGVAIDTSTRRAYVANENDGTVTVIDLAGLAVLNTFTLGASLRVESIALLPGAGFAFVTVPSGGSNGQVILLNLTTGAQTSISANPDNSGGSSDVAIFNNKLYFANQTGGSVSMLPFSNGTAGTVTTIKVDLGARALAIDARDNLLVVANQGTGTLVLIDMATDTVAGRINAVRMGDGDQDDRSDRDGAVNLPAVQSVTPASGRAGTTLTLTISGSNLSGATALVFNTMRGNSDKGDNGSDKGKSDGAFTVSNIQVSANGTQLTATVAIGSGAQTGAHIVRVITANGESSGKSSSGNLFTVNP
jgi:uncharacterized protein (TIGR03437 family)